MHLYTKRKRVKDCRLQRMERKSTAGYHEVEAGNKVDSLSADSFTGHHELLRVRGVDYREF